MNHALQEMSGNSLLYPNLNSLIKLCCAPEILESRSHHVYHLLDKPNEIYITSIFVMDYDHDDEGRQ